MASNKDSKQVSTIKAGKSGSAGVKSATVAAVGLIAATTLLAGCGSKDAIPADGAYQGNSGESMAAPSSSASAGGTSSAGGAGNDAKAHDTGKYRDGTYNVDNQPDSSGKDTIDVTVKVAQGDITGVTVVGHTSNDISKKHQAAFIEAIPGVVVGKPLKGLKVDKVAGASWTTQAFNDALANARTQASVQ
ncbi:MULTISPECIES: FMN-binding protein [Bifidobacterium]|jgi:uncharacterized protein with FMN-binding domain|uniref:FMN-binding protein n=1 Tax=Bifidobacterium tibiigranuli TaxID=2172043 RepID=A0A5N6S530_9BIFI|nr:FMN-binding protein [Bifidobacterium tibiigranuli]KAE8128748.1 FMN-binding protein [Bifidobacterium tibiigranuli]KAE8128939.1 FMN-binding protein [Bifidobacterium tibiigranuli]MCI1211358.1 FMN-binding protein [Bifidobacterium tibiigranuli]MCI1222210.1 FMN-binding protein [Bifidobacterium tibiigranuli]MCI1233111.1 FMN-binding protein [Bifidobacterium tibiigranuli]